ncbi:MAG: alternative ribosome rescue aminoacyl-tRNA hydrolase ArfB [Congregibacter sp.]
MSEPSNTIEIKPGLRIHRDDLQFEAIRASGPGGQNVNKVSSAIQLRFDINNSQLPGTVKTLLLATRDRRISDAGVLVIKAQRFRTQPKNRADAVDRLVELVRDATAVQKRRIPSKPSRSSMERVKKKKVISKNIKALRKKPKVDY